MRNFVQEGDILDFVTPAGGAVAGAPIIIEKAFLVPANTSVEGDLNAGVVEGVVELPAVTGAAAQFATAYWDATAKTVTTTATSNTKIGYYAAVKEAGVLVASVKLIPAA